MVDLEILKAFAKTEKTLEDIDIIMSMTQGLEFVIWYNDPEIHRLMCQNMRMQSCIGKECVFDSSKMTNIDFLIYSGRINICIPERQEMKILLSNERGGSSSSDSDDEKKNKKNKKNENFDKNELKNLTVIREVKEKECFGSYEVELMKQNNAKFNKLLAYAMEDTKLIVFEQKKNEQNENIKIMSRRDLYQQTYRENNIKDSLKDKNDPKIYDPEIFLFDDPEKITSVIDKVKEKINEEYNNNKDLIESKNIVADFKKEKEFMDVVSKLNTSDLKETLNYIEDKYENYYTNLAILELKLGTILQKSISNLEKGQNTLLDNLDNLRHKYYDKNNNKNKNLFQLNIDNELKDDNFDDYLYKRLKSEKKLNVLLKQKESNDKKIEKNKKIIKKEENILLNTYYCIYCHIRQRNAMSNNCHHLVLCSECIKKAKICPKCGKNIDNYHTVFRNPAG